MSSAYESLPDELHVIVLSSLSFQEAIRLSQASRRFFYLFDPQNWPEKEKAAFIRRAQMFRRNNQPDFYGFACFPCYTVKDQSAFSHRQTATHWNHKDAPQYSNRMCIDCAIDKGRYRPGHQITVLGVRSDYNTGKSRLVRLRLIVCGSCSKACEFKNVLSNDQVCARYSDIRIFCDLCKRIPEAFTCTDYGPLPVLEGSSPPECCVKVAGP